MDDKDVEVTWEDQKTLNAFATENNRRQELEQKLKEIKEEIDTYDDAEEEIMLSGEENIRHRFGEFYFVLPGDEVSQLIEKKREQLREKAEKIEEEINQIKDQLAIYKSTLYGKFGREKINLEDE